ncbi:MAG: hypothetical protein R3305_10735, partial [Gammaproteobacteria bacterium]|nr:hypothetical protein [Gammaproteobacteria bacterium]
MNARETTALDLPVATEPSYDAYAQLAKMLLPSSGCVAVYGSDGELIWCSDGYERPDLRNLVDQFKGEATSQQAHQGAVRKTSSGLTALVARLGDPADRTLGFVLIELGASRNAGGSMAASLMRPLFQSLSAQLALAEPSGAERPMSADPRLDFLLALSEIDFLSHDAIEQVLRRSLDDMDCVSAAFCVPERDLAIVVDREPEIDAANRDLLRQTRKHLLAWAQLNNRPMVVNRVETRSDKSPYKILSCPAQDADHR